MSGTSQQYCLRWNNHRSNLLTVFDELLQNEEFCDVTLACDGGVPIKCHKMVLAACSSYFQTLFTELPCKHPVVVLKDVKYSEIKAILHYMYRGEVNVAQDQLGALLKIAETLKVKGLIEENRSERSERAVKEESREHSPPAVCTTSSNIQSAAHSSSSISPPHSTGNGPIPYSKHYPYGKSLERSANRMHLPVWAVPDLPMNQHSSTVPLQGHPHAAATAAAAMLSSCYDVGSDMSPLKRKKLSSLLMNRDTPILRTVLGQGQADSSQPVPLVCHPDSNDMHSNGSSHDNDKPMKNEPSEDAQSPYTDITVMDDEEKSKMAVPSSSPLSYANDMRGVISGIATYVPQQKPEWKRYKQYTRNDILSAIEAVRNGMSALQAARKYGVPSRTLYDKVKKLGITTGRPFKRGSNGTSACFPYGISGTSSPYSHVSESDDYNLNHTALLEASASFLQHALDRSGGDVGDREALAAMAAVAAAQQASGNSTSPGNHGMARSPSPSPSLLKYMHQTSFTPSPPDDHHHETNGSSDGNTTRDEDQVEDLSISRKPEQSRVIMPPMKVSTIISSKDDIDDRKSIINSNSNKDITENRREIAAEDKD